MRRIERVVRRSGRLLQMHGKPAVLEAGDGGRAGVFMG